MIARCAPLPASRAALACAGTSHPPGEETAVSRVGIVGTGDMGRQVVDRLLAAGHEVAAYVRRPEAGLG